MTFRRFDPVFMSRGAMTNATLEEYHASMRRVLDYIDQHLGEDLGLDTLDLAKISRDLA
jgi:hypothetical protein